MVSNQGDNASMVAGNDHKPRQLGVSWWIWYLLSGNEKALPPNNDVPTARVMMSI